MEETQVSFGGGGGGREVMNINWEDRYAKQSFKIKKKMVWPQEGTSIEQEETEGLNSTKYMSVISRLRGGGGGVREKRASGTR